MAKVLPKYNYRDLLNSRSFLHTLCPIGALAVIYFVAGKFGLLFAQVHTSATAIWPGTGIALAALLLFGYRLWPGIFLGAFWINLLTAGTWWTSFLIAIGNTLEPLTAAYLIKKFADGTNFESSVGDAFRFIVFAGILAPVIAAVIGPLALFVSGFATAHQLAPMMLTWWLGDSAGAILLTPLIIVWRRLLNNFKWLTSKIIAAEVFFVLLFVFITAYITFESRSNLPIGFIVVPPLMWAAIHLGRREAMTAVLVLSLIALHGTLLGRGQFASLSPQTALLMTQGYLIVMAITTLLLSVLAYQERRNRQMIKIREQYFRSLLEKSFDAILAVDAKGFIVYASPSTEYVLGYVPNELLGKSRFDFLHSDERVAMETAFASAASKPLNTVVFETRYVRKDGRVIWTENVRTNLLDEPDILAVVYNIRDITERKQIANAKTHFISTLSHRLHPPLAQIETYINAIRQKKTKFDSLTQKYVEEIDSANRRAINLTSNLLKLTRIELGTISVEPRSVNVQKLLNTLIQEFLSKINSKSIVLERDYPNGTTTLSVDQNLLTLVLRRIIGQIVEAIPAKGKISITLLHLDREIRIQICCPIINTLNPTAPQSVPQSRGKEENEDFALEFYTVQALVELMGGKVQFDPEAPDGALVISFPWKSPK